MIAPIAITVLLIAYFVVYFCVLIALVPKVWKYALGIVPPVLAGITAAMCVQRIREIKGGEEDDLGQY